MTCPNCKCPKCRTVELNAVLSRRIVSREVNAPRDLPFVESQNWKALQVARAKEEWRDTFPVDPDAERLAGQVGALAGELERGAA